jgi:hypothetical protein
MYTALLATIKDTVAPPKPTGLTLSAVGKDTITLNWTITPVNETGFEIQRIESGFFGTLFSSWATVATLGSAPRTWTDTGLKSNTKYTYRIASKGVAGNSAFSPQPSATTTK